ncbi:MAG: hypothetical protein EAZ36_03235 [Verrucomicrobia bacterium]|nr:MAG: hypothetical protein EAZ36_03235 [Verrucomicrobiota bacterium]
MRVSCSPACPVLPPVRTAKIVSPVWAGYVLAFALSLVPALSAASASASANAPAASEPRGGGTPAAIADLRRIVEAQKIILAAAAAAPDLETVEDLRPRLQGIVDDYEALLKAHPDFAAAWAAYGQFLCEPVVEEPRQALALLLQANRLDPELPMVKNQIGVIMAEEGRVIDALNYFLAAADLAPDVALYHFQIGLLLDEARDKFFETGAWGASTIDRSLLAAFDRAVALAPERTDFAYRAAEAYYGLANPDWDAAFAAWSAIERRLTGTIEIQTVRLHLALVRWKQGLAGEARELLATVDAPPLIAQKAKLEAKFSADEAAETSGETSHIVYPPVIDLAAPAASSAESAK